MGALDPFQGVLDTGEIGLGGVGEQVVLPRDRRVQTRFERFSIDPQIREADRNIGHFGTPGVGIFADAVDRVVVVEGQQVAVARGKGIGLPDQFEGAAGVLGENDRVFGRVSMEELQDAAAGAFNQLCGRHGGGVGRVRVAKNMVSQDLLVKPQL